MIEKINERIMELKKIQEEKASKNAVLEIELRELDDRQNQIQAEINNNLWVNSEEKKELERLTIVLEELKKWEDLEDGQAL